MQYIGARYVPKFMGTFDPTQAYENMCVVDNGLGTSYISVKPTPAGTVLTDTEYWAIYGASSGAIINLQNQIGDLNNLTTTDKDSLVDAINENVSEIQALQNKYNEATLSYFKNKKVCIVGDSMSDNSTNPPNWTIAFTNILATVNATVINVATNGASITGFAAAPSTIPNDCDIYIIMLGTNDYYGQFPLSSELLSTKIATIMNRVNAVGHDVWYVSPIRKLGANTDATDLANITPLNAYRKYCEQIFSLYGARIITGVGAPSLNAATKASYMSDGLHPDTAYSYILCDYILDNIISGGDHFGSFHVVKTTSAALTGTGNVEFNWMDNLLIIKPTISNASIGASWTALCKTCTAAGCIGLVPEGSYFPSYYYDSFDDKKFYFRSQNQELQVLAFDGAGTYSLTDPIIVPIFADASLT